MGIFSKREYKGTCNICKKFWHFTDEDNKRNDDLKTKLSKNAYGHGATMESMTAHCLIQQSIVDYNRCPQCGSRKVTIA